MAKTKKDEAKLADAPEAGGALLEDSVTGGSRGPEIRATGLSKSDKGYTAHELVIRGGVVVSDKVVRGPTSRSLARAYLTRQGVASVIL